MEVTVVRALYLPPGSAALGETESDRATLRLGSRTIKVCLLPEAPAGELLLAADVWDRLAIPFTGIRLQLRSADSGEIELGPSVAILYGGSGDRVPETEMAARADLYYGHLQGVPGLFAFGFAETIDWSQGTMTGYVADNRFHDGPVSLTPAQFPIPGVVRLTWAIQRDVVKQLRLVTGERTFNWVRNLSKGQFHTLLSGVSGVGEHLPDTRRLRGEIDLAVMLAKYGVIFAKSAFTVKGRAVARVRRLEDAFEVCHIKNSKIFITKISNLKAVLEYLREALRSGPCLLQQGIPITGKEGKALDFRVVIARNRDGQWWSPLTSSRVAPDDRLVITNVANGAVQDENPMASLQLHYGMTPAQAESCWGDMVDLCMRAARALEEPLHPLGLLGFDVAVEASTHRLWLLEANTVPGWGYTPLVEKTFARSQADYALFLSGYPKEADRPSP